jgi:hypothetical protein
MLNYVFLICPDTFGQYRDHGRTGHFLTIIGSGSQKDDVKPSRDGLLIRTIDSVGLCQPWIGLMKIDIKNS